MLNVAKYIFSSNIVEILILGAIFRATVLLETT